MENEENKDIKVESDLEGLQLVAEYLSFIEFFALPIFLRKEIFGFETAKQFADKKKVSEFTLVEWKKRDGFWERVQKERKKWIKEKIPEVLAGLYRTAIRDGKAPEAKLLLQYIGDFSEKIELAGTLEYEPTEAQKALLIKALEHAGLKGTPEGDSRK